MTDPRLAHTFDWGRMYARTRGGEPEVPSITTVLAVESQDLEWWEALCAVNATLDNIDRVQRVVHLPEGPDKWSQKRQMTDWLKDAAERDRNGASARGDKVHNYAEAFALREISKATDADVEEQRTICAEAGLLPFLDHVHRFWDEFHPKPLMPEATVWNKEVGYAGTTDLVCEIETSWGPAITIMDWKTKKALFLRNGKPKDYDLSAHTGMQLAAAAHAEEVWIEGATPEEDKWVPWEYEVELGAAVAFAPDGYVVRQYDIHSPLVWDTFKALRSAWNFKRDGAATMSPKVESLAGFAQSPHALRPVGV